MASSLFFNGRRFSEHPQESEDHFESIVADSSKLFFGDSAIYIEIKKKIDTKFLGGAEPDGVLFDLSDLENPEFYLVEIELKRHDFYKHIFPQITKFFAFFKNSSGREEFTKKLFEVLREDKALQDEFRKLGIERELYKFLKDTVDSSRNILIVIDGEKEEFSEIQEAYTDTWGKLVTIVILKEHRNMKDSIFVMTPEFSTVHLEEPLVSGTMRLKLSITEEYHLEGVAEPVKAAFYEIKKAVTSYRPKVALNPQKWYISIVYDRNVAFLKLGVKKMNIVVMLDESVVRPMLHYHDVKSLSQSVQNWYTGPCCQISLNNSEHLDEVIEVLKKVISAQEEFNA